MNGGTAPAWFGRERYLSLETFRKTGVGVRTPVWFAAAPGEALVYVFAAANSGKAKRLRRNDRVRIAPCDARGRVTGGWIDGQATIVGEPEFADGTRLLNHKYRPWKQMLDLFARLRPGHRRIVIAVRPAAASVAPPAHAVDRAP